MTHEEVVQKVRDVLNEHGGSDGLSIATDRVLLDNYIETAVADAVVLLANNGYEVNVESVSDFTFEDGDVNSLGFISLISVRDRAWKKAVTKLTDVDSPKYRMSQNEFTPTGVNNPMVVRIGDMLYCTPEETGTMILRYNKVYDKTKGLKANPKEATAVCYMTAALVLGIFGDEAGKQRFSDVALNMLK